MKINSIFDSNVHSMKAFVLFSFFLSLHFLSFSQQLQWGKQHHPINPVAFSVSSLNRGVIIDNQKNVITYGTPEDSVDFDPGSGTFIMNNIGDNYIQKLDSNGNFVWAIKLNQIVNGVQPAIITSVAVDNNNDIIFTGYFSGTVDFDPSAGVYNITSSLDAWNNAVSNDMFIEKINSNGAMQWVKVLGDYSLSINQEEAGVSVTTDNQNNVIVCADFNAPITDADPNAGYILLSKGTNLIKLNSSGNTLWAKHILDESYDYFTVAYHVGQTSKLQPITVDKNDNIYCTGFFTNSNDFDPGAGSFILNGPGVYLEKLDAFGNFTWAKKIEEHLWDLSRADVDTNGNIFLAYTHDTVINSITQILGYNVSKYDGLGNLNWTNYIKVNTSNGSLKSIRTNDFGNSYLNLVVDSTFTIETPFSTYISSTINVLNYTSALINFKSNGEIENVKMQPKSMQYVTPYKNHLYVSGHYADSLDIGLGTTTNYLYGVSIHEFVAKYAVCQIPNPSISLNGNMLICNNVSSTSNFTWYLNGSMIGSNNDTLVISANGLYSVIVTSADGCYGTDSFQVLSVMNSFISSLKNCRLYPNPTTDIIHIAKTTDLVDFTFTLKNLLGMTIDEIHYQNHDQIQALNLTRYYLSSGMYLVEIRDNETLQKMVYKIQLQK